MAKQIILFIVEGESDKRSFENILNHLVSNDVVRFKVVNGDITIKSNKYTVRKRINDKIKEFLKEPKNKFLTPKDISKVVHLVDLDATFIDSSKIIKHDKDEKIYLNDQYFVPNVNNIIRRNKEKKEVLLKLKDLTYIEYKDEKVARILPYVVYYFSCNLEHVLHNNPNVSTVKQKIELSENFAEEYLNKEKDFLPFIRQPDFASPFSYDKSWEEAIKPENALKRMTNFNLFFK